MGRWFYNPEPPQNRAEVAAFGAILFGLVFACVGWEFATWIAPDLTLLGVVGGFSIGVAGSLLVIYLYLRHRDKVASRLVASEEATATDPDL